MPSFLLTKIDQSIQEQQAKFDAERRAWETARTTFVEAYEATIRNTLRVLLGELYDELGLEFKIVDDSNCDRFCVSCVARFDFFDITYELQVNQNREFRLAPTTLSPQEILEEIEKIQFQYLYFKVVASKHYTLQGNTPQSLDLEGEGTIAEKVQAALVKQMALLRAATLELDEKEAEKQRKQAEIEAEKQRQFEAKCLELQAECDRLNALLPEENARLALLQQAWERQVWNDIQNARLALPRWRGAITLYRWQYQYGTVFNEYGEQQPDTETAYALTDTPDNEGYVEFLSLRHHGDRLLKLSDYNFPVVEKLSIEKPADLPSPDLLKIVNHTIWQYSCYKVDYYYVDRTHPKPFINMRVSNRRFKLLKPSTSEVYEKGVWTQGWTDVFVGYRIHPKLLK